jgi:dipeptidyl aminopeptidase/acylaminoacyl peptidase
MSNRTRLSLCVLALCLFSAGVLAAETAAFSTPASAALVKETHVLITAGDHVVPGILALPSKASASRTYPAVLMLHGSWSSKNEVGNMYLQLARALAAKGYASLRIDFEGSGDSKRTYRDLTYDGSVADAHAAFEWLLARKDIIDARVGVIGFSRGSFIGASLVGTESRVAAFASWSGALYNGIADDESLAKSEANGGHIVMDLGWTKIDVGSDYFKTMAAATPMDDFSAFAKPLLLVAGASDDVVDPMVSRKAVSAVKSNDVTLRILPGADHIYRVLDADQSIANACIKLTADWFAAKL